MDWTEAWTLTFQNFDINVISFFSWFFLLFYIGVFYYFVRLQKAKSVSVGEIFKGKFQKYTLGIGFLCLIALGVYFVLHSLDKITINDNVVDKDKYFNDFFAKADISINLFFAWLWLLFSLGLLVYFGFDAYKSRHKAKEDCSPALAFMLTVGTLLSIAFGVILVLEYNHRMTFNDPTPVSQMERTAP